MFLFDESSPVTNTAVVIGLVISVLGNIGVVVEKILNRRDSSEVNAHTQLLGIFQEMKIQNEKKESIILNQEKQIFELEETNDKINIKLKKTQLKAMDLQQLIKQVKRSAKFLKVNDERFNNTLANFETVIGEIGEVLIDNPTQVDKT